MHFRITLTSTLLLSALVSLCTEAAKMESSADIGGDANVSKHLGVVGRVNLGSFYTSAKYVRLVAAWLKKHGIDSSWTIADLSSGYGAFFELSSVPGLEGCRYVGNDVDHAAVEKGRDLFPNVKWSEKNALFNVSRSEFGFGDREKIVIVGNPPYNDVTSQINKKIKKTDLPIDDDLRTRDLGMSSLLAYDKIKADYVAVLHPLSYLTKKSNFKTTSQFFHNYRILEHVVFCSQEFMGTSKLSGFPVIVALYKRDVLSGMTYEDVVGFEFTTTDGDSFSLSGFDYVTDHLDKYPSGRRFSPTILFYTMRDINALKRSRTFIAKRTANAIDVNPEKLAYYCYVDCFKRYADVPYYLGNFNVPFIQNEFHSVSNEVTAIAKAHHPEIFGESPMPSEAAVTKVKDYVVRSITGRRKQNADR